VCVCDGQAGCRKLADAVTVNMTVLSVDVRMTGCTAQLMHCVQTLLERNRQLANVDMSCPSMSPLAAAASTDDISLLTVAEEDNHSSS